MKFTDKECREMIRDWRKAENVFEDLDQVFDALEERLEPTVQEVVAHLERVAQEFEGLEYHEQRMYSTAAYLIRERILNAK